ncbi:hypothetical protein SERLA73DRAFT_192219 [Serpula lacrymans var. lacrymans S7.3]|uniref:Uncharacterized protein n=1 Tax=Serpula lacrymans var. lacrymans (strain S7.3) TaxID=936435 RepID=F8QJC2_SERL3|nr:hypothetical protein SERLA73DRAFT_192219 [Serpula lacrymans var. lacrymans S7.3]
MGILTQARYAFDPHLEPRADRYGIPSMPVKGSDGLVRDGDGKTCRSTPAPVVPPRSLPIPIPKPNRPPADSTRRQPQASLPSSPASKLEPRAYRIPYDRLEVRSSDRIISYYIASYRIIMSINPRCTDK